MLALIGVLVTLATAYFHYSEMGYFGFPDGHRSELERALIPIYRAFIGLFLICASYFAYLALWVRQIRKAQITAATLIYLVAFGALISARFYLSLYLDHGRGG
jgi:hypothetical protein